MNRKILVVDDESIVAHDIAECLTHLGCQIVGTALSGPDAIEKAGRFRPDLIMMDIVLQGPMDGVEAATRIRQEFDIPCVFLSAYSDPAVLARAKAAAPAGYLVKPFEEAGLRSAVEIALYKVDLERALRESKEWFMTTLLSIGDGLIAIGPDGLVRFMNPLAEALTGWYSADAAGVWIEDIFPISHEVTRQTVENPVLRAMREGQIVILDKNTILTRRDGVQIPIDDSAAPIRNARGEIVGGVLVFRDVTERRRVENEVQRYQNHLEDLVMERTVEIRSKNDQLVAEVDERRRAEQSLARRMGIETVISRLTTDFLRLKPAEMESGITSALGQIAAFVHASRCYLMSFSADGTSVTCSHEWATESVAPLLSRYPSIPAAAIPAGEVPPRGRHAVILSRATGPDDPGVMPQLAASRSSQSVLWLRMMDGEVCTGFLCVDATHDPRLWSEDDLTLLSMASDVLVTALSRWRAEDDKTRLQSQLQHSMKMEAVGKLSGGIAHDFNNVLLPIIGYSDMVLERINPEDPSVVELKEIRRAAQHAATLTRQLLAFSRKQVITKAELDLNDKLTQMSRMLVRIIGEDVKLRMALHPGTLTVFADSGQLEQVIMNLCVNARDAMKQGGVLSVRTAVMDATKQPVPLIGGQSHTGRYAVVTVSDTGCGMSKELLDRIFEPFFTTKGTEGTGLGLSVIYGIIQEHQGGLHVESTPGEGTTFRLYLPATACEPPQENADLPSARTVPTRPARSTKGTGQRVLLIEDEESVNRLVLTALTQHGYKVTSAHCAREAVQLFDQNNGDFEMIFSDAVLPDGNGVQLLDTFLTQNPNLRALLSSGYTDKEPLLELARQRRISFLPKPYTLPTLFKTVAEVMEDQNTHLLT